MRRDRPWHYDAKRIFVTPSLVVHYDRGPETLIVGDLNDREKIATALRGTLER